MSPMNLRRLTTRRRLQWIERLAMRLDLYRPRWHQVAAVKVGDDLWQLHVDGIPVGTWHGSRPGYLTFWFKAGPAATNYFDGAAAGAKWGSP